MIFRYFELDKVMKIERFENFSIHSNIKNDNIFICQNVKKGKVKVKNEIFLNVSKSNVKNENIFR